MAKPDEGGGGVDTGVVEIDPAGMADVADTIGRAAADVSDGRDSLNAAWELKDAAFGSDYVGGLFDRCCETWVNGTNSVGKLTEDVGTYTQQVANLFGATDTKLAGGMTPMYSGADLPPADGGDDDHVPTDPNLIA